ncbi:MAG TPA: hypothetical protein VF528_07905 [Pyrinomonadaceae bacterium]
MPTRIIRMLALSVVYTHARLYRSNISYDAGKRCDKVARRTSSFVIEPHRY